MIIEELKIYGTKGGWRCEDSSNENVAELRRHFSPWKWEIKGKRENDYCMDKESSRGWYTDSETLVIDRESDAQGDDIYWLHSADSEWGDPSELYQCEYDMWKVAEEMLKEGTFKRIVNYAMAVGHFIDLLNDLNKCRKKETTLGDWEEVKYSEYDCYEWDEQ
jgi:hypothetical protein|tara:strand:- start:185 stop:673 length:489 start_codon:yes stop_codon:yes gene_type:complete